MKRWHLCIALTLLVIILTFSPLVTPSGVHDPSLFGLPYTLWMGIVVALILVGLTWVGTRVHQGRNEA